MVLINEEKYFANKITLHSRFAIDEDWDSDDDDWDEEEDWDLGDDFNKGFGATDYSAVGGFYPDPYCSKVTSLKTECFQESLLELWANKGVFDETSDRTIASLTKKDIIEKLNTGNYSEFYMKEKNFPAMLSGVIRNGHDEIVSATATIMRWMGRMNATLALMEPADDSGTRGELVDLATDQFEKDLAAILLKYQGVEPVRLKVEVNVANSFGEIASGTIWGDTTNLTIGFSIVFIYVNIMLGKFNHVEQRVRSVLLSGLLFLISGILVSAGPGQRGDVDRILLRIVFNIRTPVRSSA